MNTLPRGYDWISPTHDAISALVERVSVRPSPFGLLAALAGFDLDRSARMIADSKGTPVAYAEVLRLDRPYPRAWLRCLVAADHRGCGLGTVLHEWMLSEAVGAKPTHPPVLEQAVDVKDEASIAFLNGRAYQPAIECTRMAGALPVRVEVPPPPRGVGISVERPGHSNPFLRENIGILREHFGTAPHPDAGELRFVSHLALKEPAFDPPWYVVAHTGREVCGLCACVPGSRFDPSSALIPVLSVRRIWRNQGLGLALLADTLERLAVAGIKRAELLLDDAKDEGVRRLCETVGLRPAERSSVYRGGV